MKLVIDCSSMIPIYEQVVQQVKDAILSGDLPPGAVLPSYRVLAKELDISLLTVKKAFDMMVSEGLLVVAQGKGTYVADRNEEALHEEKLKNYEKKLQVVITEARRTGLRTDEMVMVFNMIVEEGNE